MSRKRRMSTERKKRSRRSKRRRKKRLSCREEILRLIHTAVRVVMKSRRTFVVKKRR